MHATTIPWTLVVARWIRADGTVILYAIQTETTFYCLSSQRSTI
jgi:hypothetical protein